MLGNDDMKPKISVIMNCYNSETYLAKAIESVLSQTYSNFELIFWDNQSTDSSPEIVKSYSDERIKYFYAPEFTSLGIARNLAVAKASGEWISFLDSDDLWDKDKLKESLQAFEKSAEDDVNLVYTGTKAINANGDIIGHYSRSDSGRINESLLTDGNFIVQSAIMVRLDAFDRVGGFDSSLGFCPDYDLLLKVTSIGKTLSVKRELASYRLHDESMTLTKEFSNYSESIEYISRYLKNNPQSFIVSFLVRRNLIYFSTAIMLKMILKFDFEKVLILSKKYWHFLFFSPFVIHRIIINRLFGKIGN